MGRDLSKLSTSEQFNKLKRKTIISTNFFPPPVVCQVSVRAKCGDAEEAGLRRPVPASHPGSATSVPPDSAPRYGLHRALLLQQLRGNDTKQQDVDLFF